MSHCGSLALLFLLLSFITTLGSILLPFFLRKAIQKLSTGKIYQKTNYRLA